MAKHLLPAKELTGGNAGLWTDEKHVSFLNQIEASFVRRLAQDMSGRLRHARPPARLDRFVPDVSESTHNLQTRALTAKGIRRTIAKADRRCSKLTTDDSMDQVVPEFVNRGHKDEEEKTG